MAETHQCVDGATIILYSMIGSGMVLAFVEMINGLSGWYVNWRMRNQQGRSR